MKLKDFLAKLELAYKEPNYYLTGGWGKWNGTKWGWDCVCLIKGILWGWNNDKNQPRGGGAKYGSNGVPDLGTETLIKYCNNVSTDFSKLEVGEMVWMQGHVGICTKAPTATQLGEITEATAGWDTWKVIKSQIDVKGNRTYKGKGGSQPWKKHGFLPYVDYTNKEKEKAKPSQETEWTKGTYRLTVAKCIRKKHNLGNNIVKVKECGASTKKVLTSTNPNADAKIKAGTDVIISGIYNENGRIWGAFGNCWIVICNIDGTPQAIKLN